MPVSFGATSVGFRARLSILVVSLLLAAVVVPPLAAQPTAERNVEQATLALLPFKVQVEELPEEYETTFTKALTSDAKALEYVTVDPPDPRSAEALLAPLVANGYLVSIRALHEVPGKWDQAAQLRTSATMFSSPEGASAALKDPALVTFVFAGDRVMPAEAPGLGDGSAAFHIEGELDSEQPELTHLLVWQRGTVALAVSICCRDEDIAQARPLAEQLAKRVDARVAARPAASVFDAAPSYLPDAAGRLGLYRALSERLAPAEAFGTDFKSVGVFSISNPMLLNDADSMEGPLSDPARLQEQVGRREQRVVGLTHKLETPIEQGTPPGSRFPTVSSGYHLHATADGAATALRASPELIALKLSEEIDAIAARDMPLNEIDLPAGAPEGARAFRTTAEFFEGRRFDFYTVRWQQEALEMFVDVAVQSGDNAGVLLTRAVDAHRAAHEAKPFSPAEPAAQP